MKTTTITVDIPDHVLEMAKEASEIQEIPFDHFVSQALIVKSAPPDKPWVAASGQLSHLHEETMQIMDLIEETFDPEMIEEREKARGAAA